MLWEVLKLAQGSSGKGSRHIGHDGMETAVLILACLRVYQ